MANFYYTELDIKDLASRGVKSITLDEDTRMTDLAFEKAARLGISIINNSGISTASIPERPYLVQHPLASAPNNQQNENNSNILSYDRSASEDQVRRAIVETGRLLYQSGLITANDGNISARLADGNILITPAGVCKGRLQTENLLLIDPEGKLLKAAADHSLKPTSEQPMHLEAYYQRKDVFAVIHTHLVFANALAIAHGAIRMDVIPEAAMAFNEVPVTDFSMPSSAENATAIRNLIHDHDVLIIRNHGSLAVATNLEQALIKQERLEYICKTLVFAELLGNINPLPSNMLATIRSLSKS